MKISITTFVSILSAADPGSLINEPQKTSQSDSIKKEWDELITIRDWKIISEQLSDEIEKIQNELDLAKKQPTEQPTEQQKQILTDKLQNKKNELKTKQNDFTKKKTLSKIKTDDEFIQLVDYILREFGAKFVNKGKVVGNDSKAYNDVFTKMRPMYNKDIVGENLSDWLVTNLKNFAWRSNQRTLIHKNVLEKLNKKLDEKFDKKTGREILLDALNCTDTSGDFYCFVPREMNGHPGVISNHAYGQAIDVNHECNPYLHPASLPHMYFFQFVNDVLKFSGLDYDMNPKNDFAKENIGIYWDTLKSASNKFKENYPTWLQSKETEMENILKKIGLNVTELFVYRKQVLEIKKKSESLTNEEKNELLYLKSKLKSKLKGTNEQKILNDINKKENVIVLSEGESKYWEKVYSLDDLLDPVYKWHSSNPDETEKIIKNGFLNIDKSLVELLTSIPKVKWGAKFDDKKDMHHFDFV